MNDTEIQKLWLNEYQRLEKNAEGSRDSISVPFALLELYDKLSDREKQQIEPVLAEWLMSDDSKTRYDARFIARKRNIRSLKPAAESAIAKLAGQPDAGVRFEVELLKSFVRECSKPVRRSFPGVNGISNPPDPCADTMNDAEIQQLWLNEYQRLIKNAEGSRDSMSVPFALVKLYDKLSDREKQQIEPILAEWLVSDDGKNRYCARFIAGERKVRSLKAAVERSIAKLIGQPGPGVRFEVELLESLVRELSE